MKKIRITENQLSTLKSYLIYENQNIKEESNPCWDGYEMVGMKEKDGKEVPNCVPKKNESVNEDEKGGINNREYTLTLFDLYSTIEDFMEHGNVDPGYRDLIQKDLDSIRSLQVKRRSRFNNIKGVDEAHQLDVDLSIQDYNKYQENFELWDEDNDVQYFVEIDNQTTYSEPKNYQILKIWIKIKNDVKPKLIYAEKGGPDIDLRIYEKIEDVLDNFFSSKTSDDYPNPRDWDGDPRDYNERKGW